MEDLLRLGRVETSNVETPRRWQKAEGRGQKAEGKNRSPSTAPLLSYNLQPTPHYPKHG